MIRPTAPRDRRQPYTITGAGRQYLEEQVASLDQVVKTRPTAAQTRMKRLIRWAAALYPSAWRERYGTELDALMEDMDAGWLEFWDICTGAIKMQILSAGVWRFAAASGLAGLLVADPAADQSAAAVAWHERCRGLGGPAAAPAPPALRLAALAVRRCLVIRICDILHPSMVRVVSILTVKGGEATTRCRHGQHPNSRLAGCYLGMPAGRISTLLEQLDRGDRGPGACWRRAPHCVRCDLAIRAVRRGRPSRHARPVPCPRSRGTRRRAGVRARSRPRAALPRCC